MTRESLFLTNIFKRVYCQHLHFCFYPKALLVVSPSWYSQRRAFWLLDNISQYARVSYEHKFTSKDRYYLLAGFMPSKGQMYH